MYDFDMSLEWASRSAKEMRAALQSIGGMAAQYTYNLPHSVRYTDMSLPDSLN